MVARAGGPPCRVASWPPAVVILVLLLHAARRRWGPRPRWPHGRGPRSAARAV